MRNILPRRKICAMLGLAMLAVPCAHAQEETKKVETFTITGSHIQRDDLVSSTPITQIDSDEILFQGTARVEDMLRSYPQVYVAQGSGDSNGATGTATVELRGLGTLRTLVLVNGRRMPAGSAQLGGVAPDINQIPGALIKRVDILTGGASAAYGSDAIAGVVNFLLMDDFEGVKMDVQYSEYQHNNDNRKWQELVTESGYPAASGYEVDGSISKFSLIAGRNFLSERGNVTAYATYRDIKPVLQGARDYSSCSLSSDTTECLGSSTIPEGRFTDFGLNFISQLRGDEGLPELRQKFSAFPPFDYLVEGQEFVPRDGKTYNFGPANYYQRPDERYTLGAFAHYDLNDWAQAYAEFMYMDDRTTAQIAPSGNFFHTSQLKCSHPLLTEAQRAQILCDKEELEGEPFVFIGRRNVEGGPRRNELSHVSYRGVLGMRGDLDDFWNYDAFVQYAEVELRDTYENDLSITRIRRALDAVTHNGEVVCNSAIPDADGTVEDPDCVPWNIFEEGAVTREMINYLALPLHARGTTDQFVMSASFSGDLSPHGVKSPFAASSVSVALGGEFRKESLDFGPDENYQSGEGSGQGGATSAVSGDYHVVEVFAEASIPLIENAPYVQKLTLDTAYRYSDYDYGEYIDTWAFRLGWEINPQIRIRGSVQRAVRGATVQELFLPQRFGLFIMSADPCAGAISGHDESLPGDIFESGETAQGYTFEQCARTGVTQGQWGNITNSPAAQYNVKVGGNPDLSPEEARTWSAGIVFTPDFAEGLTLAVDYYKIEIEHGITGINPRFILTQCLTGNDALCPKINRGQAGDLWVGSDVDESGHVESAQDNLAVEKTNGLDVTLDFTLDLGSRWGEMAFNDVLTHINALDVQAVDGAPVIRCAGNRYCGPTPDLQNRLRITWDTPWDVTASLMWRHTSAVDSSDRFVIGLPRMDYFDLAAVWNITDSAKVYAGINNLADRDPPIVGSAPGENGNTYPGLYDVLGRYVFMGASMEF